MIVIAMINGRKTDIWNQGKDAIEWIMKNANCKTREEALTIARSWLQMGDFHNVDENANIEDTNALYEFKVNYTIKYFFY